MLDKILRHARKKWQWRRYADHLKSVRSIDEFHGFLQEIEFVPPYITDEPEKSAAKRKIAETILDHYGIDVAGKRVLDIGPGFGDFMDVCRERGALAAGIDHDPFVVRWLQLRGHIAVRGNVLDSFAALHNQQFEVINSIGSIVVEYFALVGFSRLRALLQRVERHLAPDGSVLVCPHFEVSGAERRCKIADPLSCRFTDVMRAGNYHVLKRLPGVHVDGRYTLTYGRVPKGHQVTSHYPQVTPSKSRL